MKMAIFLCMLLVATAMAFFMAYRTEIQRYEGTARLISETFMCQDGSKSDVLKDLWERPMLRRIEQNGARIRVVSCGHDGKPDTKDDIIGIIEKDGDDFSSIVHWQYMFSSENLMEGEFTSHCKK